MLTVMLLALLKVSHHPPIAACNCESPNYCFWQGLSTSLSVCLCPAMWSTLGSNIHRRSYQEQILGQIYGGVSHRHC